MHTALQRGLGINILTMDTKSQFSQHLRSVSASQGFALPWQLNQYLAELLAARLTDLDITPQPSFAQRYLELYLDPRPAVLKHYADTCLISTSLMPGLGARQGLDLSYYATLGISTYYALGDLVDDHRFTQLGNWFYVLQRFLDRAFHSGDPLALVRFMDK